MNNLFQKILRIRFVDSSLAAIIGLYLAVSFWEGTWYQFLGIIITCTGFVIWVTGVLHLGSSFNGLPVANRLVTTGIYSAIRHPVYTGSVLVFAGFSIITLNSWILFSTILLIVIQLIRGKTEEYVLEKHFRDAYTNYKKKTIF